jgi:hypothetical protein
VSTGITEVRACHAAGEVAALSGCTMFDDCANWNSAGLYAVSTILDMRGCLWWQRFAPSDAIRENRNEEIAIFGRVVANVPGRRLLHHPSSRASGTSRTSGRSGRDGPERRSRPGSRQRSRPGQRSRCRPTTILYARTTSVQRLRRKMGLRQRLGTSAGLRPDAHNIVTN